MVNKEADLIISSTMDFVRERLSGDSSGHDWWHIYRVWQTSVAIGIGRTFAYGGFKGRSMYTPGIEPKHHVTAKEYLENQGTTINHFHEKLLLLKDRMNTEYARSLAEGRHRFMEQFLTRFHEEWEGKG